MPKPKTTANKPTTAKTKAAKTSKPKAKPKSRAGTKQDVTDADLKGREVVYPESTVSVCIGQDALNAKQCRYFMGWEEETAEVKFGQDYFTKGGDGTKVRAHNNFKNRPLVQSSVRFLMQEILSGNWRMNWEPIIIGRTGLVINGQHSMTALITAAQAWRNERHKYPVWKEEPTIDKLVVCGADESEKVRNTMDTCRPRSLADVLFHSHHLFHVGSKDRAKVCHMAASAIRFLWLRLRVSDAFGLLATLSEQVDFLDRHPTLVKAVSHVYEDNQGEGAIPPALIGHGYLSGLLYLIACSDSDAKTYNESQKPDESMIKFGLWDKAADFFTLLAGGADEVKQIRLALGKLGESEDRASEAERFAVIIKGWQAYHQSGTVFAKDVRLSYYTDPQGIRRLSEDDQILLGGIDVGGVIKDPTEDEIKERKAEVHTKRASKKTPKPKDDTAATVAAPPEKKSTAKGWVKTTKTKTTTAKTAKKKASKTKDDILETGIKIGDTVWVAYPTGEGHWKGQITSMSGKEARVKVLPAQPGAGSTRKVLQADLLIKDPASTPEPTA